MPRKFLGFTFPKVGMRIYKTLTSVLIVALVYDYVLGGRNPCFACIGAVFGMGTLLRDGVKFGGNRFIGTLLGGLVVIPVYWLTGLMPGLRYLWLIAGLFCVIYLNLMCGTGAAIHPGSVVFFVVMFTITDDRYISYTVARIIDTGVGVVFSLIINWMFPNPEEREHIKKALLRLVKRITGREFDVEQLAEDN